MLVPTLTFILATTTNITIASVNMTDPVDIESYPGNTAYDSYIGRNKTDLPTRTDTITKRVQLFHDHYMVIPALAVSINNVNTYEHRIISNVLELGLTCKGRYYGPGVKLEWVTINKTTISIYMEEARLEETGLKYIARYCFVPN